MKVIKGFWKYNLAFLSDDEFQIDDRSELEFFIIYLFIYLRGIEIKIF